MDDEAKCGIVLSLWVIIMSGGLLSGTAVGYSGCGNGYYAYGVCVR